MAPFVFAAATLGHESDSFPRRKSCLSEARAFYGPPRGQGHLEGLPSGSRPDGIGAVFKMVRGFQIISQPAEETQGFFFFPLTSTKELKGRYVSKFQKFKGLSYSKHYSKCS